MHIRARESAFDECFLSLQVRCSWRAGHQQRMHIAQECIVQGYWSGACISGQVERAHKPQVSTEMLQPQQPVPLATYSMLLHPAFPELHGCTSSKSSPKAEDGCFLGKQGPFMRYCSKWPLWLLGLLNRPVTGSMHVWWWKGSWIIESPW